MSKIYTTVDGLFGTKIHYDENGRKVGESIPGLFKGTMNHFDADGNLVGTTTSGLFSGTSDHFDANGRYAGTSTKGLFSGTDHIGRNGRIGHTESLFGMLFTDIDD